MRPVRLGLALAGLPTAVLLLSASPARAQDATWNFTQADVTAAAQAAGKQGAGVTVAVIDTWVEGSHADFGGRVLTGADCSSGTCTAGSAAADGCEPHGTHVSGTIASASYGVAPGAKILPLRVLAGDSPDTCAASTTAVAAAIDYAIAQKVRVMNLSLGSDVPGQTSTGLASAVQRAANAGIVVVFAAGNSSRPLSDSYGGNAIVVAATGPSGAIASYSQYGTGVTMAAPGGDVGGSTCTQAACVVSTWSQGRFAALEGTSMAAPHVAGAAALLFAQNPSRSRTDVITILKGTARPLANAGSGLLDVNAALAPSATQTTSAAPAPTTSRAPILTPTTPGPRPSTGAAPTTPPAAATTAPAAPTTSAAPDPSEAPGVVTPDPSFSPPTVGDPVVVAGPADEAPGTEGLPLTAVTVGWLALAGAATGWVVTWRRQAG